MDDKKNHKNKSPTLHILMVIVLFICIIIASASIIKINGKILGKLVIEKIQTIYLKKQTKECEKGFYYGDLLNEK